MATHSQDRITKDTSARKGPAVDVAREVKAVTAGWEAYHNSIVADHITEVESLKTAHAKDMDELKARLATNEDDIQQKQQNAINKTVTKALQESNRNITLLKHDADRLAKEKDSLRTTFDEHLEAKKDELHTARQAIARMQSNALNVQREHESEIADLKRQLEVGPNSKIEVGIVYKGRVTRHYTRRLTSTFEELVRTYITDLRTNDMGVYPVFWHGVRLITDWKKTLEQLGIKDGDEIEYKK